MEKLESEERDIRVNLAIDQPSKIDHVQLDKLLSDIRVAQKNRQLTRNDLEKQYNWSIQLQAGAQQYLPSNQYKNQTVELFYF